MIEFFFDCSSPWTYLGFHNIQPLAAEAKVALHWRPILVGGVFNAVNPGVYAARDNPVPAKRDYQLKDLQDWARLAGLRIVMADAQGRLVPFATAVFEAYWGRDQDISQDAVLAEVCERCGIDAPAFFAAIAQDDIKAQLKANTEELIRRGGFGSPTIFLGGDDMYFGNDRLPLLREALRRRG